MLFCVSVCPSAGKGGGRTIQKTFRIAKDSSVGTVTRLRPGRLDKNVAISGRGIVQTDSGAHWNP